MENKNIIIPPDENGFIWGKTHDLKSVGIYTGKDIELKFGVCIVNVWHYIVTSCIPEQLRFKTIKFENGAISTVNPCNALHKDFAKEEELNSQNCGQEKYYVYKEHNDSTEFSFPSECEVIKWIFTSKIEQHMSIDAGDALKNDISALLIIFEKEKKLNTFINYYKHVTDLLAFLTFRRNISFEKISLEYGTSTIADCYIKSPDNNIATVKNRGVMEVIKAKMLDNTVFINLVNAVMNDNLPMSIIPEDRNAVYKISGNTIKNICSALEVELDKAEISISKSQDLTELIESVKNVIKQHRDNKNTLEKKTYDVLFSSIGHWGDSLADRLILAWKQNHYNLQPMLECWYSDTNLQNQDIINLVKARNDITHRAILHIDDNICNTAFLMYSLIYCMVLKRLGFKESTIAFILKNRLIG